MSDVIEKEEVVLVVHRRLFTDDQPRFFVGSVEAYDDGVARIRGYTWLRDPHRPGAWHRKEDVRTKLVALCSGTLMVYPLPVEGIDSLDLVSDGEANLVLRDGQGFEMDLSERMDA